MPPQRSDEITIVTPIVAPDETSRPAARSAHLIVLSGTNVGQVFNLRQPKMTLGRDESAEIQILDAGISRRHAQIIRDPSGSFTLHDAGSRNGTFANNQRVEAAHLLKDGDKIQLGVMTILKFSYDNATESHYAQTMYEAALRDGLTGLYNRRYFDERLRSEFAYADRHRSSLALLLMDLDNFKSVNDARGHLVGDLVLKDFGKVVLRTCRTEDVFCRYGGEEFGLLCRDTDLLRASILGERIRHETAAFIFAADKAPLQLTVSIGISSTADPGVTSHEELIAAADEALYQAKARGRNCVIIRSPRP